MACIFSFELGFLFGATKNEVVTDECKVIKVVPDKSRMYF